MRPLIAMISAAFLVATVCFSQPFEPDANTAGLWHFDEPAGNYIAFDASGNGYNMFLQDGAEFTPAGYFGGAVDLTDADAKVSSVYLIGNGWDAITIDAYIYATALFDDEHPIVMRTDFYNIDEVSYYFHVRANGSIAGGVWCNQVGGAYADAVSDPGVIQTNQWYRVALTWSSGQPVRIFVDDMSTPVVQSPQAPEGYIRYSTDPLLIGYNWYQIYGYFYWQGKIDEVRISDIVRYAGAPPLTVTYPNGGEVWQIGDTPTITWTHEGGFNSFDVLLSRDNGSSWETLDTGLYGFAIDWTWNAGVTPPPSDECLVKIVGHYNGYETHDISDGAFSIVGEQPPGPPFTPDEYTEALWHFDEAPGTYIACDATGNGYDMALEDGAEFTAAGLYAGGVDITDPDAKINSNYLIGNGWDELTIDAHIKLVEFSPDEDPVVYRYEYYTTNPAYFLTIYAGGRIYAGVYQTDGSCTSLTTDPIINLNTWYYIQMTWRSGGELKIFLDGTLVESVPASTGSIRNSTHPLTIGWFHDIHYGDFYSNGFIDEVRISDIDRSEQPPPSICFEEHWTDGNWTANPTWHEYDNMGNFAINFGMGHEAAPCLEGWAGYIGTDYTALYTPVNCGQAFTADFWVHKRTTEFSIIMIGFCEGPYHSTNRGFRVLINYSNLIWDWELIIYDVDDTQLFYAVIDYDDDRWTNIHMNRNSSGDWEVIWDYNGPYEVTAHVTDSFVAFNDPHLWVHPSGYYGNTGGFYLDDIVIYTEEPIPPLAITLTPYNPPIVIPPGGDAFAYNIEIANNGNTPETFDVWVNIEVPGGYQFTVVGPVYDLTLAAGSSVERDRTVFVPGSAPAGEYTCMGLIGTYPWTVIASDAFSFTKEGADGIWTGSDGWILTGEPFPGEAVNKEAGLPSTFALLEPFPNPFNPVTTVLFTIPQAAHVKLTIYDLQGRRVADLVDGSRDAGMHEVSWDASDLASGLYFCRIQAGDYSAVRKMMLVK